jgi:competence protein ComFB
MGKAAMQLVNFMEEIVKKTLDDLLQEPSYSYLNLDDKAKLDILAYALNHLPPRYAVTEKGLLFTRLNEFKQQFTTDIVVELTKAIKRVEANPR